LDHPAAPDHDRLVQLIYDGADDPRGFQHALVAIADRLRAPYAQLLVVENSTALLEHRFHGAAESGFHEYFAHWKDKDPRFAAALRRPDHVLSDVGDIDRASFERSAIFNEVLLEQDARYSLFGNFQISPEVLLAPAFMRGQHRGPFDARDIAHLTALMPHLRRATRLRCLVRAMQAELDDLGRALDAIPSAVVILDRSAKVVCANAPAEALLREGGGLRTERGKLTASMPATRRELSAAIARSAEEADAGARRPASAAVAPTISIPLDRDGAGCSLSLVFFALRPRSTLRGSGSGAARVLVVLHDPRRRVRLDPALVAKVYGLTATEAALATALAEGQTLAEFARARGCTEQTARTHLKRILDKTGTHRQADLVRVLLGGVAMHGLP
jgi:DNA-binding CsgD family transcriptional regulator